MVQTRNARPYSAMLLLLALSSAFPALGCGDEQRRRRLTRPAVPSGRWSAAIAGGPRHAGAGALVGAGVGAAAGGLTGAGHRQFRKEGGDPPG